MAERQTSYGNNALTAGKVPAMELLTASHHRVDKFRDRTWQKFRKIAATAFIVESRGFSLRRSVNGTKHGETRCRS
jgi:hypothetical protein